MSALLQIDGITKKFGPVTAVDRITLEVKDGEFFGVNRQPPRQGQLTVRFSF